MHQPATCGFRVSLAVSPDPPREQGGGNLVADVGQEAGRARLTRANGARSGSLGTRVAWVPLGRIRIYVSGS